MKLTSTIKVDDLTKTAKDQLLTLFATEDKIFSNERAQYKIIEQENSLEFEIKALDTVALRAVLNAIVKVVIVYDKMGTIVGEDNE